MTKELTTTNGHNIQKEVDAARNAGANILIPTTHMEALSEFHAPVVDQVFLSPDPEKGDVYMMERGYGNKSAKYAISKQGLSKLSVCAGIIWAVADTRRMDDRRDRDYVSYQAVGGIRKTDGTPVWFKAEYDLDLEVVEEEIRENHEKKTQGYEKKQDDSTKWWHRMTDAAKTEYLERNIRRDLLQKRKHKLKLAETGAMNRVVRAILGLKDTYTAKELQKPFVMMRIILQPDYSDERVREKMTEAAISAMMSVYGPPGAAPSDHVVSTPVDPGSMIEVSPPMEYDDGPDFQNNISTPHEPPDMGGGADAMDADFTEGEFDTAASKEIEFKDLERPARIKVLKDLMSQKGWAKPIKKPLEKFTDDQMLDFWRHLYALEDTLIPPDDADGIPY